MQELLRWYEKKGRDLPWRKTTDPYLITVSEFMLQQTQVSRVLPKFEVWRKRFPDWNSLAKAPRQEVLAYWSGLGYNSRAARLHTLAKVVVDSGFPDAEEELKKLPGIGPYTAGAIRAFAYDLPGNFVDVNVERVFFRLYFKKIVSTKKITEKLHDLQQKHSPRELANALMDLGSFFCTVKNPSCEECPLRKECQTRGELPQEKELREKKKQSSFKNSNRWWRGQILKLLTRGKSSKKELLAIDKNHEEAILKALEQLKKEELIEGEQLIQIKDV